MMLGAFGGVLDPNPDGNDPDHQPHPLGHSVNLSKRREGPYRGAGAGIG